MLYIIIVGSILLLAAVVGVSCKGETSKNERVNTEPVNNNQNKKLTKTNQRLSRKEIRSRLIEISKNPVPNIQKRGAMCYKMARASEIDVDFTCSKCLKKDKIKVSGHSHYLKLEHSKDKIEKLKKYGVYIDNSEFCPHCHSNKKYPKLCWVVKYETENDIEKTCNFRINDINMLIAFFNNKIKYDGERDAVKTLKNSLTGLRAIFGIEEEK